MMLYIHVCTYIIYACVCKDLSGYIYREMVMIVLHALLSHYFPSSSVTAFFISGGMISAASTGEGKYNR